MTGRIRAGIGGAIALSAALLSTVDIAGASLPYDAYRSDYFRIGRLHYIDFPLTRRQPVPQRLATIVVPFAWIDGATPSLEADRFVRRSQDDTGLMVGRSAYEAAPSACPAPAAPRGHDAMSLVFDPSPERCAGLASAPSDISAR